VAVSILEVVEARMKAAEQAMFDVLARSLWQTPWHIPRFAYVTESTWRLTSLRHEITWRVRHAWDVLIHGRCENGDES
jgi:hypothetical protein